MRFIIIGGVAAGMSAAMKIRRELPEAEIVVYQKEAEVSYAGCGLPYFLSGLAPKRESMIARKAEVFRNEHKIELYTEHEVTSIKSAEKRIEGSNLRTKALFTDRYDRLLIATGASPLVPPFLKVDDVPNYFVLRSITDADRIKEYLASNKIEKAVLIGDGFIAMEMAETMVELGIKCTVVAGSKTVMRNMDADMGMLVEAHLEDKGVEIIKGYMADGVVKESGKVVAVKSSGKNDIQGDFFLLSIGVKPNSRLAEACGIKLSAAGAIEVDEKMRTNIPDIYAAGDCIAVKHMITGKPVWIPLGSTANKTGKVAGTNMAGGNNVFAGVLGTFIAKVCDIAVGKTGIGEAEARELGITYSKIVFTDRSNASYYPNSRKVNYKVLFDPGSRKLLGLQAVGGNGVDKRIDVFATAMFGNITIDELYDIDLSYAPPFNKPLDSMHIASNLAEKAK